MTAKQTMRCFEAHPPIYQMTLINSPEPIFLPRENVMSEPARPYEPLTSENAALVLVDHQIGLMTGVRDYSTGELKHNVVALARRPGL
jgi:hypothetical protein